MKRNQKIIFAIANIIIIIFGIVIFSLSSDEQKPIFFGLLALIYILILILGIPKLRIMILRNNLEASLTNYDKKYLYKLTEKDKQQLSQLNIEAVKNRKIKNQKEKDGPLEPF
jgi:hypothetical protein